MYAYRDATEIAKDFESIEIALKSMPKYFVAYFRMPFKYRFRWAPLTGSLTKS